MSNKAEDIKAVKISIIQVLMYISILPVIRAFVLGTLWYWYIVPTFGLQPLTMIQAYGLSLFVTALTHRRESKMEKDWKKHYYEGKKLQHAIDNWSIITTSIGEAITYLAFGWLGTLFM